MKQEKDNLRNRLLEYIAARQENGRIPGQRTISEEMGVTCYLVRKHLANFQKEGLIYKKDRQGVFLNDNIEHRRAIGLITGDGHPNCFFDGKFTAAGILMECAELGLLVRHLTFREPKQLPGLAKRLGLCGIVCVLGNKIWVQLHKELIRNGIPAVCADLWSDVNADQISNTILWDMEKIAVSRARFFIAHGIRHICYLSQPSRGLDFFRGELASHGIPLPDECIVQPDPPEKIHSLLPELIRKYAIDGILCDGFSTYLENLFPFLADRPEYHPLLCIDDFTAVRRLMVKYPQVKVDFPLEHLAPTEIRIGREAVRMMMRSMDETLIQPSRSIDQQIVDRITLDWQRRITH